MKNKKILVLSIAMILMAMVVGVVAAQWDEQRGRRGNTDGVIWVVIEGVSGRLGNSGGYWKYYIEVYNNNSYGIACDVLYAVDSSGDPPGWVYLAAGETKHFWVRESSINNVAVRSVQRR